MNPALAVGSRVHYVAPGSADGTYPCVCRPAVVVEHDGRHAATLMVINPTGVHFRADVVLSLGMVSDGDHRGFARCVGGTSFPGLTWHWPEEARERVESRDPDQEAARGPRLLYATLSVGEPAKPARPEHTFNPERLDLNQEGPGCDDCEDGSVDSAQGLDPDQKATILQEDVSPAVASTYLRTFPTGALAEVLAERGYSVLPNPSGPELRERG